MITGVNLDKMQGSSFPRNYSISSISEWRPGKKTIFEGKGIILLGKSIIKDEKLVF